MTQLIRHRHRQKIRIGMLASAVRLEPLAATGAPAPSLVLRDPEDARNSIISGSITTLIHGAAFGLLFLLAWLAPPVEELIPVRIIRELPGSNAEPAPARRILKPRRQRAPIAAARHVTPQAVAAPRIAELSAEQVKLNELRKAAAPQTVQRRQVVSQRTQVRAIDTRVQASKLDLSKLTTATAPTDLVAPVVDLDGPRQIDPGAAVKAPENYDAVPDVKQVEYTSAAPFQIETDEAPSGDFDAFDFDMDTGIYAGGDGTGGTGSAVGTVRCLESAYVLRYLDSVRQRTENRWQVPVGSPQDTTVRVRFVLDASGSATRVEFIGDTDPLLGNSTVSALRAASPFPPMDDNVRCLAGKRLTGLFTVQSL